MHRDLRSILRAPTQRQFWRSYVNILRHFREPARAALWYTLGRGTFPRRWSVRTPSGPIEVELYSIDDLVTLVECFGKRDYAVTGDEKVIVDFGSNIGISALYFLTHAPRSHVHLFEPVPSNVERLRENLRDFEDRVTLATVAVGVENATAEFTVEPTGRYGGLGTSGSRHDHRGGAECR